MTATVNIDTSQINSLLRRIASRIDDLTPIMRNIGESIRTSVEDNFEAEGRPVKWQQSARVRFEGGKTLTDTARLRNSISVKADKKSVAVGTNVKYAGTHQFGARRGEFGTITASVKAHTRKRGGKTIAVRAHQRRVQLPFGNIPKRPFLMVHDEDRREISRMLNDYIQRLDT